MCVCVPLFNGMMSVLMNYCSFYFVGDEDLLEIIGNSKNIPRLQKHFKKMFAGVASIILSEDESHVNGLISKEGEEVWRCFFFSPHL